MTEGACRSLLPHPLRPGFAGPPSPSMQGMVEEAQKTADPFGSAVILLGNYSSKVKKSAKRSLKMAKTSFRTRSSSTVR